MSTTTAVTRRTEHTVQAEIDVPHLEPMITDGGKLAITPESAAHRTGHDGRSLLSMSALGVLLSACMSGAAVEPIVQDELLFERHEIVTGTAKRQTVLTGFLLGGTRAELATVSIDGSGERRLHLYAFDDGTWAQKLDSTLSPAVSFIDVAKIGGRDRLITYERGRLSWFDPDSATERELLLVTSNFKQLRQNEIPHVDISRDLNGDGRDDLVVPDVGGFRVFIQMNDGAFADPVEIGTATDLGRIHGADGYRYDPWGQSRVHEIDYDQDGRCDLMFWKDDHFEVHLQDERGLLNSKARTFTTEVAFDSDSLSCLATGDMRGRVLHSLTDLNGDGVADLVVFSLQGGSIASKHSSYEVHFGAPTPEGGTVFAKDVDIALQSDGRIQIGMVPHDFDRDGQIDLMFTTIETAYLESGVWRNLKGFMGDSIRLRLEFFRMKAGRYSDRPDATSEILLRFPATHREPGWLPLDLALRGATDQDLTAEERELGTFNAPVLIGDVIGDRRSDVLVGRDRGYMRVHFGVAGPDLLAPQPLRLGIDIPYDGEYTWLVELDRDGKKDILMHHASDTEPHRVTMLIAR